MNADPTHTTVEGTIVFADVGGSSLMYAARGDEAAFPVITACLRLMEEQVARCGGRLIKHTGDGVLALFRLPADALRAAVGLHETLQQIEPNRAGERPLVRMGMSHGTAVLYGDDLYGDAVNVAARLVSRACKDEVLLTDEVHAALPDALRSKARLIDEMAIRDYPRAVAVYQYVWTGQTPTDRVPAPRTETVSLELVCGQQVLVVDPRRPRVKIGRAEDNDIRIEDTSASRYHAEVLLRDGKPVVLDLSTNGTHVRPAHGAPLRVLREEVVLVGSGDLIPGALSVAPISYRVRRKRHHAPLRANVVRLVGPGVARNAK
jgi:adenylate cyclase